MAIKVSALIITGYGTNCEIECEYAARQAGADETRIIHFSELQSGGAVVPDYNFLIFPGGFLDGDDLGAAQAAAQRWQYGKDAKGNPLLEHLQVFLEHGGIILGICNGFQLLVKLGLLPALDSQYFTRQSSLTHNSSARFEDRWCHLTVNPDSPCIFTRGLESLYLPVRHGEGHFVPKDEETLARLDKDNLITVRYAHPESLEPTQEYPYNPNGSPLAIAGICDPTGRIFGLMPHPEAFNHLTNHPHWTSLKAQGREGEIELGLSIFQNGVRYLKRRV